MRVRRFVNDLDLANLARLDCIELGLRNALRRHRPRYRRRRGHRRHSKKFSAFHNSPPKANHEGSKARSLKIKFFVSSRLRGYLFIAGNGSLPTTAAARTRNDSRELWCSA